MVFEIALGVFIGIVLAAFVLKNWQQVQTAMTQLLAASVWLAIGAIVIGILITVGILVWLNLQKIAVVVGALVLVAILYGVPFWTYSRVSKKYPTFGLLLKGESPWDRPARLPLRLSAMAVFAVTVAGLGIGALMVVGSIVDYFDVIINGK